MTHLNSSRDSFDSAALFSAQEDAIEIETPTGKGPHSSLWTERLHHTSETKTKTPMSEGLDATSALSTVKNSLFSPQDILKVAFASRIVQRDVSADTPSKSKTTFLLSSPSDNLIESVFAPQTASQSHQLDAPVNICGNIIKKFFTSNIFRAEHGSTISEKDIYDSISNHSDDSSWHSESLDLTQNKRLTRNRHLDTNDDPVEVEVISDDDLSTLNEIVEDIIRLTSEGEQNIADIQYVVENALTRGVPKNLLKKIVHGLMDDTDALTLEEVMDKNARMNHQSLDSSPMNAIVHLAYASSVKAFIGDIRRVKLIHDFDDDSVIPNLSVSNDEKGATVKPSLDKDDDDDDSDHEISVEYSNANDPFSIDDEMMDVQSEMIQRALNMLQRGVVKSDLDTLRGQALSHNFDVTLFEDIFHTFYLHPVHDDFKETLLQVFIGRAISKAQQGQQLDRSMSLLIAAAHTCGLPTDIIKRRFLKERKRWIENQIKETADEFYSRSSAHEDSDIDGGRAINTVEYNQETAVTYHVTDEDEEDDTPRKEHVAEFHTIENGDAEFFLMEDEDVEVAFFDELEEVRKIDEARESGKRMITMGNDASQNKGAVEGTCLNQGLVHDNNGIWSFAPIKSATVRAVSAAFALKFRNPVKITPIEARTRKGKLIRRTQAGFKDLDPKLLLDWPQILKTPKIADDRSWDTPDAHLFLSETRYTEPRSWLDSFTSHALNVIHTEMSPSTARLLNFQITPSPQICELASINAQKVANPSVGKIFVDLMNTRDQAKVHGGKMSVFMSAEDVQLSIPSLGSLNC